MCRTIVVRYCYKGMICVSIILIGRVLAVVGIIVAMVLVLVGIEHMLMGWGDMDDRQTERLRKDMKRDDRVITEHSLFYGFLSRNHRRQGR